MTTDTDIDLLKDKLRLAILEKCLLPPVVEVRVTGDDLPDWLSEPRKATVDADFGKMRATFSASWKVRKSGFYFPETAHIFDPETGAKLYETGFWIDRPDAVKGGSITFTGYVEPHHSEVDVLRKTARDLR